MKTQTAKILIDLAALMVTGTIARAQYTCTTLDDPLAGLSASTFAFGISGSNIVGYYYGTNGAHGFRSLVGDPLSLSPEFSCV